MKKQVEEEHEEIVKVQTKSEIKNLYKEEEVKTAIEEVLKKRDEEEVKTGEGRLYGTGAAGGSEDTFRGSEKTTRG